MLKKIKKNQKGFSLVEVLFALLVLAVGIVGVLTIMVGNIKNSIEARDQIIAAELVQEGLELVRHLSDNASLSPGNKPSHRVWADDFSGGVASIWFTSVTAPAFRLFIRNNAYVHQFPAQVGDVATRFARRIDVVDALNPADKQRTITSTVSWDNTGDIPAVCNIANRCARGSLVISY
jgi:prepilin-type N-terminal cleavage/methylation domain-containing protein